MKLRNGKKYETADGVVLKVFEKHNLSINWVAFESFGDMGALYDVNGVARGLCTDYNLIRRHYTKPKPADKLDLQPGDVVQLVAWEDGTTCAGNCEKFNVGKNGIKSGDWNFNQPKGERPLFRVVSRSSWPTQTS